MDYVDRTLSEVGLALPSLSSTAAAYVGFKRSGNLVVVSGQLPLKDGLPLFKGKLGQNISTEQGYEAAQHCALNVLAQLKIAIDGDWDKIVQFIRVGGFVASTSDYVDAPKCVNGASELFLRLFGERGKHARAAIGVVALPADVPVEIEAIVEIA